MRASKRIGDICEILNGFAFKSNEYVEDGIRVMRITNVQKGEVVDDEPKFFPSERQGEISKYLLREGDLLMSLTGNVGRVGLLPFKFMPAALNQRVACLRLKSKEILMQYLFHILNSDSFEADCIFNASGIAQKNMSTKWLEDYVIPVPPLAEQERIVAELDLLSGIIDKQKAQLKELDILAQSIFYDMFGNPVENEKGWNQNYLINVVDSSCSLSYGIVQPGDDVEDGVPVVRPIDLTKTYVIRKGLKRTSPSISNSYKRTILQGNEVLLCVRGTTGILSLSSEELRGCNTTRGIVPIRFGKNIERLFGYMLLKTREIQSVIAEHTYGTTLKQINIQDVKTIPFVIPPINLQIKFADYIASIEQQKKSINQSIAESQKLFDYTMDKHFG